MSKTIRVDPEVYGLLLGVKADLEKATGQARSFSDAVAFLIALAGGRWRRPIGDAPAPSAPVPNQDM